MFSLKGFYNLCSVFKVAHVHTLKIKTQREDWLTFAYYITMASSTHHRFTIIKNQNLLSRLASTSLMMFVGMVDRVTIWCRDGGHFITGKSKSCIKHACMSAMCEHSSFVRKCMHEKKNARGNWRIMGQIRLICEVNYTCITCTMMFANSFHKQMYMGQTTRLKPAWRGQRCIAHGQIMRGKGCFQPTEGSIQGQP